MHDAWPTTKLHEFKSIQKHLRLSEISQTMVESVGPIAILAYHFECVSPTSHAVLIGAPETI